MKQNVPLGPFIKENRLTIVFGVYGLLSFLILPKPNTSSWMSWIYPISSVLIFGLSVFVLTMSYRRAANSKVDHEKRPGDK